MPFEPKFTISIPIASALTAIERTRGFLEAATLYALYLLSSHKTSQEMTFERVLSFRPASDPARSLQDICLQALEYKEQVFF
jgi:hypothetical protein